MSDQRVQKFITSRSPNCVYVLKDKLINKLNTPEFANSDDVSTVAVYLETCFDFFFLEISTLFSKWSKILFFS